MRGSSDLLATSVRYLKGVGPRRASLLNRLGVETIRDLLYLFPRRYEDRTTFTPIAALKPGERATICGVVREISEYKPRAGMNITRVMVTDGSGAAYGVWFNQPYMKKRFKQGMRVAFSGKVNLKYRRIEINSPEFEEMDGSEPLNAGRMVPIYPLTEGLSQRWLREQMRLVADSYAGFIGEILPEAILKKYSFPNRVDAIRAMHFPSCPEELEAARRRLAFEELFLMQLCVSSYRRHAARVTGYSHKPDSPLVDQVICSLPFKLTSAQERVWHEISTDMEKPSPMNRLLQGDVGSGKTVLAILAMAKCVQSGYQAAMMAPTEILAEQHFKSVSRVLTPFGIRVGLLTSSTTQKVRRDLLNGVEKGSIDVLVGTHALLQEGVAFRELTLAITDEQHRFGVRQRASLISKGLTPDTLVMTATPIPRTLALTLYGDLDISIIDEMPPGRQPVQTSWFPPAKRGEVYSWVRERLTQGDQAYVVCPLIEESDTVESAAAVELAQELERKWFKGLRVGVLHGRLKSTEKLQVLEAFRCGEISVLVSTTVVEVGIDVPNATVLVVEGAERFGLAELHQLRGRVGRGVKPSYCFLLADPRSDVARERLDVLTRTQSGFEIAEEDLKLRGPGEFLGTRQHGELQFRVADLTKDLDLLLRARDEAEALLRFDPHLDDLPSLKQILYQRFYEKVPFATVG